jgi:hypothetical protein
MTCHAAAYRFASLMPAELLLIHVLTSNCSLVTRHSKSFPRCTYGLFCLTIAYGYLFLPGLDYLFLVSLFTLLIDSLSSYLLLA